MQQSFFTNEELAAAAPGFVPPPPRDYHVPTQFPSLLDAKCISLDLETHDPDIVEKGCGARRSDSYIVGASISVDGFSEYYPVRHSNGQNVDEERFWQYLRDNLNDYRGTITGANVVLYDGDWLQSKNVRPVHAKWWDVQWAEALIDDIADSYSLEALGKKYLGRGKAKQVLRELYGPDYINRFREVHPGHARAYGIGDVTMPLEIKTFQETELARLGMTDLFNLESRLAPFLLYMREQGVRVNLERAANLGKTFDSKRDAALRRARELSGVHFTEENFGRISVLAPAFEKLGIEVPTTERGNPSITDAWLNSLEHPVGKALAAANRFDKAKETFVDGYITDYVIGDRIYGEFNPLRRVDERGERGAVSGRFSGTHPNLQNIPARENDEIAKQIGPPCRAMFIPEEGAQWFSLDFSQIEYRYLVHNAVLNKCKGASKAQEMYVKDPNVDFHQGVATLTGLDRKTAKNLNFALVYGAGKVKLAISLGHKLDAYGKPPEQTLEIFRTYHEKAPFIKELLDICAKQAQDTGEIRTILGRRSQFEMYEPAEMDWGAGRKSALPLSDAMEAYGFNLRRSMTHKALNRLLQGSAADHMKKCMVDAWEAGICTSTKDFTISITVHDELDGSLFPTQRGIECYTELKRMMEVAIPLEVPVYVSEGIGMDWSEAH